MSLSDSISRLTCYYRRNGLQGTIARTAQATRRALFSNKMVLFYCDLASLGPAIKELPEHFQVERKRSEADVLPNELQAIASVWNPKLAHRNIQERFLLGASLWMINVDETFAGYGWTLRGHTVEPHYLHLGPNDVHLFDFHVFPQFRGQRLNPLLVTEILRQLAVEAPGRAYIEAAEWNHPQLSSLTRTPFHHLGIARKFDFLGRALVLWSNPEPACATEAADSPARGDEFFNTSQQRN